MAKAIFPEPSRLVEAHVDPEVVICAGNIIRRYEAQRNYLWTSVVKEVQERFPSRNGNTITHSVLAARQEYLESRQSIKDGLARNLGGLVGQAAYVALDESGLLDEAIVAEMVNHITTYVQVMGQKHIRNTT